MNEKKVASLKIVFEDGSDYSVACEKGLDKDELANYIERAFKPTEPLIKDEKIRKAVRAWAEASDVGVAKVAPFGVFDIESSARIYFYNRVIEDKDYYADKSYTIAELCGKEEE